jgi:5-methylcytosine-specific restriction endonuclease McrA
VNCGERVKKIDATYCNASACRALRMRLHMKAVYAANPEAQRRRVAAVRATRTAEQAERDREYIRAWKAAAGYHESKRAYDQKRRALKAGATVESFRSVEIYDRDGWRCGICGKKIRQSLTYPHPMSVSLDHIVPLSHGGEHSRANTRAAHLKCNVDRGAARGETGQQLALI